LRLGGLNRSTVTRKCNNGVRNHRAGGILHLARNSAAAALCAGSLESYQKNRKNNRASKGHIAKTLF
jgi:hypothetical protein